MLEPITLDIEKLVYQGDGLARLDGQVVLVPFVLPGEQVSVMTKSVKNGLLRGSSPNVLKASSERETPRCEYFANCGGCHYQHAQYAFELQQKRAILCETLQRLGGITYENDIHVISGDPWYYRNRIQLHFSRGNAGFRKAESHELCAITHCEISSPVLNEVIEKLQWAAKQPEWPPFLRSLEVFTNETELQLNVLDSVRPIAARFFRGCGTFLPGLAQGPIEYRAAGHTFRISRGSFFQVNRFLVDALVEEVVAEKEGTRAVDLYAGVGLFSSALGRRFKALDAVERSRPAHLDLEWNTKRSEADIRTFNASAEEFLSDLADTPDLIVADPPRAGLGPDATSELLRVAARKLTIVSCDPATLARDLRKLLANYRIERLTLIDLFPRTYHFETVVHLERTEPGHSISV
jgi:23S rRNA (uracil1939-C5)-methyltransferase